MNPVHICLCDMDRADRYLGKTTILHRANENGLALVIFSSIDETRQDASDTLYIEYIFNEKLKWTMHLPLRQLVRLLQKPSHASALHFLTS